MQGRYLAARDELKDVVDNAKKKFKEMPHNLEWKRKLDSWKVNLANVLTTLVRHVVARFSVIKWYNIRHAGLQGDVGGARTRIHEALESQKRTVGVDHHEYAKSLRASAGCYNRQVQTRVSLSFTAITLVVQGRLKEAVDEAGKAIDILKHSLGEDHEDVGRLLTVRAGIYKDQVFFSEVDFTKLPALYPRASTRKQSKTLVVPSLSSSRDWGTHMQLCQARCGSSQRF